MKACPLISFTDICCLPPLVSVSYTHLRAHETRSNLVCRLLLEKYVKGIFLQSLVKKQKKEKKNNFVSSK